MSDKNTFYGTLKTSKEVFKLTKQRISIGRDKNSTIVINNNTVSKDHAILEFDEDFNCIIKDLNSSNGTYVNGQKLKTVPLKLRTGDKIKFGKYDIEYIFESSNMLNDTKTEQEITMKLSENLNDKKDQKEEISHTETNNIIKDGKISLVNENELSYPKINHFQNNKNIIYSFGNSNGMNYNSEQNVINQNININNKFDNKNQPIFENNNKINNNEDEIVEQYTNNSNIYNKNSNLINNEYANKNQFEKYEKKIAILEKEKEDMKELINEKTIKLKKLNNLFDELNEEYSKLNSKYNSLISYSSDIQKKLDQANEEISEFKYKNNLNNQNNLNELLNQKDNIISIMQNEINYYKELCNKKGISLNNQDDNNKLNSKLNTISNIFVNENNKLKKKLEFYKNKIEKEENNKINNINFKQFETQINYQIDNFNNIISSYNSKLLDSLNKLSEIFDTNNKEEAAKYLVEQINEYMIENQKLISENSKLNTQILELQSILNAEYKSDKLKTKKNFNNFEFEDSNIEMNTNNNSEINKLKNKINEMESIVEKLKNINKNNKYENDYNYLKDTFVNILNELKQKEKLVQDLQLKLKDVIQRNNNNFDENQIVTSISQKLKEKDNIIQNLKNQINTNKNLDIEDSKLKIENIRKKRELFN